MTVEKPCNSKVITTTNRNRRKKSDWPIRISSSKLAKNCACKGAKLKLSETRFSLLCSVRLVSTVERGPWERGVNAVIRCFVIMSMISANIWAKLSVWHPIAYSLTQQPFWLENEAARASKLANDHFCLPLCKNDKRCYSDRDLSYLNFPSDKHKRKHPSSIEYTQGPCLWPSSLVTKCKMVTAW